MNKEEHEEALKSICDHYALPLLLQELDAVITNVEKGMMSIGLKDDPEKAMLSLYAERMKLEGANATRIAFKARIAKIKEKKHE